jgi:hypothetical protein
MKFSSSVRFALTLAAVAILIPTHAFAAVATPEIDPSTATSGLVLLTGTIMLLKGRRRS